MVDGVVNVFTYNPSDLDIQTHCLFAFYRFACHTDSRSALIGGLGIVDAIIRHSSSWNPVLSGMANSVLEVLVIIEREWSERIKRPRYMAFNDEWNRALKYRVSRIKSSTARHERGCAACRGVSKTALRRLAAVKIR
jgi:hypothetical protein